MGLASGDEAEDKAVTAIEKLGGKKITDADLAHLKALSIITKLKPTVSSLRFEYLHGQNQILRLFS